LGFYRDVLGFDVTQRLGDSAAFLSAGGYHHHIGLNTWETRGGSPPPPGTTGLYHVAIRFPDRRSLAQALRRVLEARIPPEGASPPQLALHLHLPDGRERLDDLRSLPDQRLGAHPRAAALRPADPEDRFADLDDRGARHHDQAPRRVEDEDRQQDGCEEDQRA